jgi:hypothetical protein
VIGVRPVGARPHKGPLSAIARALRCDRCGRKAAGADRATYVWLPPKTAVARLGGCEPPTASHCWIRTAVTPRAGASSRSAHQTILSSPISATRPPIRVNRAPRLPSGSHPLVVGAAQCQLWTLRWCFRKHGCHTFWIDVEGQECQRFGAGVPPSVHEAVRFVDRGTGSPCRCLAVDRVGPRATLLHGSARRTQ